ncbi:MAG: ABC transporter ATP-binding protein [Chloroflexi bacterium]|nr:ABC transporter ATP-binding protein [Chloroflexota bacterium]
MIDVQGLTKYYADQAAIKDVTFEVKSGEILGFLGPNGAGKTTTMRILSGFMPASSGRVKIAGYDTMHQSLEARKRVGYLPENVPLYTDLTVGWYLDFLAKVKGLTGKRKSKRIAEAMEVCNISHVAGTIIGKLSKGYRQRVGLAQALVHDPPVLILDEPTVGLDPKQITETRQLIKRMGGQHTIILSTHILPEVSMTCSRVVIISQGQIVAIDSPDNLTKRLQGSERVELEVRGPKDAVARRLRGVPGVLHVETEGVDGRHRYFVECAVNKDLREQLAAVVVNEGWGLLQLRALGMSLEEIFLKLTTKEEVTA